MTTLNRDRLQRVRREAEGYLELGMPGHALGSLQRSGKIVHCDARGSYLLGECFREMRRYREAIFPLRRSLELIPDDIHVWMALAWCYKRVGHVQMSLAKRSSTTTSPATGAWNMIAARLSTAWPTHSRLTATSETSSTTSPISTRCAATRCSEPLLALLAEPLPPPPKNTTNS